MASTALMTVESGALSTHRASTSNPAAVYLASLAPTGRYSMMRASTVSPA